MRNVSDRSRRGKKAHLVFNNFVLKNRAVYEIMWENIVEWDRQQITIWRIACRITKATHTHTQNM